MGRRSGKSDNALTSGDPSPAVTFLLGAVVGGLAGAMLGALVGRHSGEAVSSVANAVEKLSGRDREDRPRFELLLQ